MQTIFTVDYQRLVGEEEYEPDTKEFTDKEEAMEFAAERYSHVDYTVEDETDNFKLIDGGFVNMETGELVSRAKRR